MAYNTATLPTYRTISGTFTITLLYDDSLGTLTQPTFTTVKDIGDSEAVIDRKAGVSYLPNLKMTVRDSYAVYAEGFWHKVLAAPLLPRLKITLDEGDGDTAFFFGQVDPMTVQETESYVSDDEDAFIRNIEFEVVTFQTILDSVDSQDWIDNAYAQRELTGLSFSGVVYEHVKWSTFFAALLEIADINPDFDDGDIQYIWDETNTELRLKHDSTAYSFADLWMIVSNDTGEDPTHNIVKVAPFDTPNGVTDNFPKAKELFELVCKSWAFFPEWDFDPDTGRVILLLKQKGHTYSSSLTMEKSFEDSTISRDFDVRYNSVRVFAGLNDTIRYWQSTERGGGTGDVPADLNFDLEIPVPISPYLSHAFVDGAIISINAVEWYSYTGSGYESTITDSSHRFFEALCLYEFYRLSKRRKVYDRTYGSMKASLGEGYSHKNVQLLALMAIDDGAGSQNFYINKIVKKAGENRVALQLVQT